MDQCGVGVCILILALDQSIRPSSPPKSSDKCTKGLLRAVDIDVEEQKNADICYQGNTKDVPERCQGRFVRL